MFCCAICVYASVCESSFCVPSFILNIELFIYFFLRFPFLLHYSSLFLSLSVCFLKGIRRNTLTAGGMPLLSILGDMSLCPPTWQAHLPPQKQRKKSSRMGWNTMSGNPLLHAPDAGEPNSRTHDLAQLRVPPVSPQSVGNRYSS